MRFCHLSLRREGVLGICRLVVSLFRRCITFCKECKLSRLNEISGGFEKILPVSGSFRSNLKFFRMMDLTAWLWGWNVTSNQAGSFKCARTRCKTCPFICNVEKLSGPKRSIKITDHFTCTSTNVIYCITCTLIHRRNRETTRRQILRTPSRRRERRQKHI